MPTRFTCVLIRTDRQFRFLTPIFLDALLRRVVEPKTPKWRLFPVSPSLNKSPLVMSSFLQTTQRFCVDARPPLYLEFRRLRRDSFLVVRRPLFAYLGARGRQEARCPRTPKLSLTIPLPSHSLFFSVVRGRRLTLCI